MCAKGTEKKSEMTLRINECELWNYLLCYASGSNISKTIPLVSGI